MTNEDRRVFQRIPFDASTELRQGEQRWPVTLVDLSLQGLLIEAPADWPFDRRQTATASIMLNGDTQISMDVRWRHSANGQIGFACEHIDIDSISHLRRLLELNLGDSSLLERELSALGS